MTDVFDVNKLLQALEKNISKGVIQLNSKKNETIKNKVLKNLHISTALSKDLQSQLENYRYVNEIPDLQCGGYIRWISLKNKTYKLTTGGNICQIKVHDDGIHVVCRNKMNMYFQIRMNENLVFQKLTNQEKVLLSAMDYLDNK